MPFVLPSPAPEQSTVKCVGSLAFSPLLSTPGPNTFTMCGWLPLPILTYERKQDYIDKVDPRRSPIHTCISPPLITLYLYAIETYTDNKINLSFCCTLDIKNKSLLIFGYTNMLKVWIDSRMCESLVKPT